MSATFEIVCAIHAERLREDAAAGFAVDPDAENRRGELARRAAAYLLAHAGRQLPRGDRLSEALCQAAAATWPGDLSECRQPIDRQTLIIAAALVVAEIARIDRRDGRISKLAETAAASRFRRRRRAVAPIDTAAELAAALGRVLDHFDHLGPLTLIATLEAAAGDLRFDAGLDNGGPS